MARRLVVALVCCAFSGAGCADLVEPPLDLNAVHMPIVNGSPPDAPRHNAVVGLLVAKKNGTFICSGTLIRDRWVGTAAHCLWDRRGPVSANAITVYLGNSISGGFGRAVNGVFVHPAYNDSLNGANDVALLRLATAVPACTGTGLSFPACADPVRELPPALALSAADIGVDDALDFAGFGRTSATGPSGVKLHAFNELGGFGCGVAGCPTAGNSTTQYSYDQSAAPCSGDSGGPGFIQRNGVWYDAGPTSWGDSACTVYGVSMRWDAYASFIASVIGCSSNSDCSDNNTCTTDVCNAGVCQYAPVTCPDDGDACTSEVCVAGSCTATPVSCDDGEICTADACEPATGCAYTDVIGSCDDGDACTVGDACGSGTCQPGAPSGTPACTCSAVGATCSSGSQCCSGTCRGHRCR